MKYIPQLLSFLLAGAAVLLLDQTKCVCADSSTLDHNAGEMAVQHEHENGHPHNDLPIKLDETGSKLQVKGKNGLPNIMDRHLSKSSKKCNPKNEPFQLWGYENDNIEYCQRGCPDYFSPDDLGFVVAGSTASKTAKECCDKYPDTSPEGYCFNYDQACVCKEQPFYHFDVDGFKTCQRGCELVELVYFFFNYLPSSPTTYTTGEKCCEDKGCDTDIDGTEAFFDTCCDPKEQPFYVYSGDVLGLGPDYGSIEICTRGCPSDLYGLALVQGSKASKTAKECCAKNPNTSPEGFCFDADEAACLNDKQLCEKRLWYHYDFIRPDNSRVLGCRRGCFVLPGNYYFYGELPTSTTGYMTVGECCEENECEITGTIDRCDVSTTASTSSAKTVTTNTKFSALGIMTEGFGGVGSAFGLLDDTNDEKGLFV